MEDHHSIEIGSRLDVFKTLGQLTIREVSLPGNTAGTQKPCAPNRAIDISAPILSDSAHYTENEEERESEREEEIGRERVREREKKRDRVERGGERKRE